MKLIGGAYDEWSSLIETFPQPTLAIGQNMLNAVDVYLYQLETFANSENATLASILPDRAALFLNNLGLVAKMKEAHPGTPENMLIEFAKVLPVLSAGLRQIVSSLQCSIGKLTNNINDNIKSLERSLQHILQEFLNNGVKNLALGKKTDFEPVIKCLQKLANTIAVIADAILNDSTLATDDVYESVTILTLILTHCFVVVQSIDSTIATIVHTTKKYVPDRLNSCLSSIDPMITGFANSIRSVTTVCAETLRRLLTNLVSLTNSLDVTLKEVFGLVNGVTLTVGRISQDLSYGVSSISRGLANILA